MGNTLGEITLELMERWNTFKKEYIIFPIINLWHLISRYSLKKLPFGLMSLTSQNVSKIILKASLFTQEELLINYSQLILKLIPRSLNSWASPRSKRTLLKDSSLDQIDRWVSRTMRDAYWKRKMNSLCKLHQHQKCLNKRNSKLLTQN